MAPLFSYLSVTAVLIASVYGHPGHNVAEEAAERAAFFEVKPRSIGSCAAKLQRRGHTAASLTRRNELARRAQEARGLAGKALVRRDFSDYNISHASTAGVSFGDDETLLFADNSSCILQPEVTQGPYYVDGEMIRKNLTEDQLGVPLYLDIQFLDTSSCEPVTAAYVDLWHCNATGVYSGVSASGNGDANDTTNIDNTFLRGLQQTDANGVVQFETIVPGHYTGRATHIHIMSHAVANTTIRTNGTILGSNGTTHASHVGQLFFDQSLLSLVEATEPYVSNTQAHTLNSEDIILGEEADSMDPFVQYLLLGDTVEDGILAWISIGIDSTADEEINSASTVYADGAVANENSMGGGSGGGGAPSGAAGGTVPSGSAMPSGTPPSRRL